MRSAVVQTERINLSFYLRLFSFPFGKQLAATRGMINSTRELIQPRRRRQQKPPQICIFDNEKQYLCTLCTCIFHLLTFWRRSRSFYEVKWPVLLLCGRREHMMTDWFQFNSRMVRTHFLSKMTLNNRKMIAETRSYIFRWRSRSRRRRVSLSSLLTHLRPKGHKNIFCHFFWRQEKVCKLSHIRRQRVENEKWQNITRSHFFAHVRVRLWHSRPGNDDVDQ